MRFLIDSSASTTEAYFVLCPPMVRQVSLLLRHNEVLQSIAAGIGTSNFQCAFFMISSNSPSSGSMKKIPGNLLALSSFGFSIVHFCFSYVLMHQTCVSTFLAIICRALKSFVFSSVSLPDHEDPSGGSFSLNIVNLAKPVHVSDNSRSPSTFQQSSMFLSNNTSKHVSVALVTSIYFSEQGNDSSLGTCSLTLGST